MPETTGPERAERPLSDAKILVPHREVRLMDGRRIVVAPWGMVKGSLVLERLDALQPKLIEHGTNARQLLARAYDECVDLVTLTIDVERSEIERPVSEGGWTFEDLLRVFDAVLDVCVARGDGGGALPLLVSLFGRLTEVLVRTDPRLALELSPTSEPAATSTARSGNGSASRRTGRKGKRRN